MGDDAAEARALARVLAYDAAFVPRYAQRFGARLLGALKLTPRANVLDLGCRTGYPCVDLLDLAPDLRVMAIDPDAQHLELARARAGAALGRRIFFKQDPPCPLRFGDEVFTHVVGNLVTDLGAPRGALLADCARVLQRGGQLAFTLGLRGSFAEAADLLREVALGGDLPWVSERVESYALSHPTEQELRAELEALGFRDVLVESWEFTLRYGSSEALFGDPVIEVAALPAWRWCAEGAADPDAVLRALRTAVDTYFQGIELELTVVGGCVSARRG
jgi:SAM-dependent methyltransferase